MQSKFENFVNKIVNNRGINQINKEDLRLEIIDHLILAKEQYRIKGYNEEEPINLPINNFGDTNIIGNDIKHNLPSGNKVNNLGNSIVINKRTFGPFYL